VRENKWEIKTTACGVYLRAAVGIRHLIVRQKHKQTFLKLKFWTLEVSKTKHSTQFSCTFWLPCDFHYPFVFGLFRRLKMHLADVFFAKVRCILWSCPKKKFCSSRSLCSPSILSPPWCLPYRTHHRYEHHFARCHPWGCSMQRGLDAVRRSTVRRLRDAVRGRGRQARSDTERADAQGVLTYVCVLYRVC
jgi:hypothetical protein